MSDGDKTIEEANKAIAEFNMRFEQARPAQDIVSEPWLSSEAMAGLPHLGWEFDKNRDPSIEAQLRDLDKSEAERRGEQAGSSEKGRSEDQPKLELRPPRATRPQGLDADAPAPDGWLKDARADAMSKVPEPDKPAGPARDHGPANNRPEHER